MLGALRAEPDGSVFALSLRLGLRPGEAAALHWDDIDLDGGIVRVHRGARLTHGRPEVVDTLKTAGSARDIGLPDGAR